MKSVVAVSLVVLIAGLVTAGAAPLPEEAAVDIALGYCMSQKTGSPMPARAIDPRTVGTSLAPSDGAAGVSRVPGFSSNALRIPTASGAVYTDSNRYYCNTLASGVDRARTIARIENELRRLGLTFEGGAMKNRDELPQDRRPPSYVLIVHPAASNPRAPEIMIAVTYLDDPSALAIGVTTARASPPPEETVADLVVGYCMSQKLGIPLSDGAIDPRKVGTRVTPADGVTGMTSNALRIPTTGGAVFYDYNETQCRANARGVDRARVLTLVEDALKKLHLAFEKAPVTNRDEKDKSRSPGLVLMIPPPAGKNAPVGLIMVTHFDDPRAMSVVATTTSYK